MASKLVGVRFVPVFPSLPAHLLAPFPSTTQYIVRMSGKGKIRIVADVPSATGWLSAKRGTKGSYMKTLSKSDGLVVRYKSTSSVHGKITLVRRLSSFPLGAHIDERIPSGTAQL